MVQFRVEIQGAEEVVQRFREMAEEAKEPSRATKQAIIRVIRQSQEIQYGVRGRSNWTPLKPISAARKVKRGRSTVPLAGGVLERSLTQKGAKYAIGRLYDMSVVVGTSDPVARLHQTGTKNMPKRRPIVLLAQDKQRIGHVWLERIMLWDKPKAPRTRVVVTERTHGGSFVVRTARRPV